MSEFEEIKSMLRDHMKDSQEGQMEIKQSIARIETHNEYTVKSLNENKQDIDKLKSAHNRQKGMMWAFGLIGLGGVAQFIKNMF